MIPRGNLNFLNRIDRAFSSSENHSCAENCGPEKLRNVECSILTFAAQAVKSRVESPSWDSDPGPTAYEVRH